MPIDAEKIRSLRERFKLTQTEFAMVLGITQEHVSRLETGRKEPGGPMVRLLEMIEHFGLPPGKSGAPR